MSGRRAKPARVLIEDRADRRHLSAVAVPLKQA